MPAAIPLAAVGVGAAASAGAIAAGTATFIGLSATTWAVIGLGASIAGTLATTLLAEQPPKPKMAEGNLTTKQPIPSRTRGYGRVRSGGELLYDDSTSDGDLNRLLHHVSHLVAEFEERWLAAERVQLDEDGNVTDDPWWQEDEFGGDGDSTVVVVEYLGTADQVVDTIPNPPWTTDHRGAGLCMTRVKYSDLGAEDQARVFPRGPQAYSVVLKAALIFDPRDVAQDFADEATFEWSDNGALVVLDFLTRVQIAADGTRVPWGFGIKERWINFDSFADAADDSDDEIDLKDGGVENRWRIWGKYELTEDRKAVLGDLLDACCGRLLQGPDGKIGLDVGKPDPVAAVTITDPMIKEYDLSAGKSAITRVNEVRVTYVAEAWNFNEVEAGIQSDLDAIDRNGLESIKQALRFVPAESQAQRVAKFLLKKGSPSWQGRIRGTLALLDAWGERWVRLTLAELEIDQIFEIGGIRLIRDDGVLECEMEITSYDGWFDWNPETDEQDPAEPPPDTDEDGSGVPMPENVAATIEHRAVNGQGTVAIGVISCDPAPRTVYKAWARVRPVTIPTSPPDVSPWELIAAPQDTWQVKTGPLADGAGYEAQMSFTGPRGSRSKWVPLPPPDDTGPVQFTATADPVAPASPTGLTAQANTPGTGQVTVSATQPNDPRAASLRFYRNSSDSFVGATLASGPYFAGPGSTRSFVETPGVGDWWYFATSSNGSNVASTPAGGVLAEVSPAAVTITSPTNPTSTNDNRLPVSGTGATAGAAIKLYANAVQVGTGTADGSGNWTVTPSTAYGNGVNALTATQTVGGNESAASGAVSLTVAALDTDARVYIDAMTPRPSSARMGLIDTLVAGLKTDSAWLLLDGLFLFAAHDAQAARINVKTPASIAVVTGSPAFAVDSGYTGAVSSDIDLLYNPSTGGGNWALNSATLLVYGVASVAGNDNPPLALGTAGTGATSRITPRTAGDQCGGRVNDATFVGAANTTTLGSFSVRRSLASGAGAKQIDKDGVQIGTATTASTAVGNATFRALHGTGSAVSNIPLGVVAFGGYFDNTKILALHTRLHAYLQAIGAVP
ncbi:hypothetical protein [Inquilinus sp. CA228]|uniref:hypothetical protein n=1 Tax=Inquilinus sp. CA228 TaxID=3455609 RepID=UPI003F8CFE1B